MGQQVTQQAEVLIEEISISLPEKVGILGGTFNPPHLAHMIIAEQVLNQLDLDMILFMPTSTPPHKDEKEAIDGETRLLMTQLAISQNPHFQIEAYEVSRGGKNYTFDTMTDLQEMYPETTFYFIIGADMVEDLPNWYRIEELANMVQFVAVSRPGYNLETNYPVITIDTPNVDISSSEIRQMVASGRSIRYLVDDEVRYFIEEEGLYHDES